MAVDAADCVEELAVECGICFDVMVENYWRGCCGETYCQGCLRRWVSCELICTTCFYESDFRSADLPLFALRSLSANWCVSTGRSPQAFSTARWIMTATSKPSVGVGTCSAMRMLLRSWETTRSRIKHISGVRKQGELRRTQTSYSARPPAAKMYYKGKVVAERVYVTNAIARRVWIATRSIPVPFLAPWQTETSPHGKPAAENRDKA